MKKIDCTQLHIEKKLIFLPSNIIYSIQKNEQYANNNSNEELRHRKHNTILKLPLTYFFDKNSKGLRTLNLQKIKNPNDFSFFSFNPHANSRNFISNKASNHYLNSSMEENSIGKRRKRRKFTTDEERRIARILKNRRTAEESRQRRIQKMKDLENFAASFDEKEKKLREEIQFLGKQNANQAAELDLLKEKLDKNI